MCLYFMNRCGSRLRALGKGVSGVLDSCDTGINTLNVSEILLLEQGIKLPTPLTNKITPESAIKLNIPAGTLTALAVRARARARTPSHSNTALSALLSLSLSANRSNHSFPLKNNYSHIAHNYL